jgi:hypothetical protein
VARNQFIDLWGGAGAQGTYNWPINHAEEDARSRQITVERTATTDGIGFVRQLGAVSPYTLRWKGTILDKSQHDKMMAYFDESNGLGSGPRRTVHLVDQLGIRYEGWFTMFNPIRVRTSSNPRGTTPEERMVYWTYDMEFEVVRIVSGV